MPVMAAVPVMVPVFVVGLPQLPASILALPDMDATVMLPDTSPTTVIFAFPSWPRRPGFVARVPRGSPEPSLTLTKTG